MLVNRELKRGDGLKKAYAHALLSNNNSYANILLGPTVCPIQNSCAVIIMPSANHQGLEEYLKEISFYIFEERQGVVVMDRAG